MVSGGAGLNRDLLRLNNVLRMHRGQETSFAAATKHAKIPRSALPDWLKIGAKCCYVSKSKNGGLHNVKVQKIDEKQQVVTVVFEQDVNSGKKVPFAECSRTGDGTLRPVFKSPQQAQTQPQPRAQPQPQAATSSTPPTPASASGCIGEVAAMRPLGAYAVEDISSGDEGKATSAPRPMFMPRVVALAGKKAPAAPVIGPMGPEPSPEAPGRRTAAEISDDEVVATDVAAVASGSKRNRSRSRSLGRPAPAS
mmetsp:Transcript_114840/g.324565  ORF Transcript_114840/g.324565 Transcript_114840/m.324565 type:complete len:252 (-) Transcript_114840:121-876(-)